MQQSQSQSQSQNQSRSGDEGAEPTVIDCDNCAARGPACHDCVVSVLLGVPDELLDDERAALDALAAVGLAPRLRLVPVRRGAADAAAGRQSGVA